MNISGIGGGLIAGFVLYWIIRLAVRHGIQDVNRHIK